MWKYFSANNTKKYIDILNDLIRKYNNSYHRAIGCTPVDARNHHLINTYFKSFISKKVSTIKRNPKFEVGEKVRIRKKKEQFEKASGFTYSN